MTVRNTFSVTTTAANEDFNADGGSVLVEITGASSWDGTVDFQTTPDGATFFNVPYIRRDQIDVAPSVAQISSPSTAVLYEVLGPLAQVRINCGAGTTGTLTVVYRTIPFQSRAIVAVQGMASSDAAEVGNPVQMGGSVDDTSPTAAGEGDVRRIRSTPEGNLIVEVYRDNVSQFGASTLFDSDGDNTAQAVKTSAGTLWALEVSNPNSADGYLQLFDVATGSVTVGSTTPKLSLLVPAGDGTKDGAMDKLYAMGINFATAITYACTTTPTGSGDPSTGLIVNVVYS